MRVGRTVETTWDFAMDTLGYVLRLEVDSDDVRTGVLGHGETGRDGVDGVDLGGAHEDGPLDTAQLAGCQPP
jgi:hypothetical protein